MIDKTNVDLQEEMKKGDKVVGIQNINISVLAVKVQPVNCGSLGYLHSWFNWIPAELTMSFNNPSLSFPF